LQRQFRLRLDCSSVALPKYQAQELGLALDQTFFAVLRRCVHRSSITTRSYKELLRGIFNTAIAFRDLSYRQHNVTCRQRGL
jgi:hypothetical protein